MPIRHEADVKALVDAPEHFAVAAVIALAVRCGSRGASPAAKSIRSRASTRSRASRSEADRGTDIRVGRRDRRAVHDDMGAVLGHRRRPGAEGSALA